MAFCFLVSLAGIRATQHLQGPQALWSDDLEFEREIQAFTASEIEEVGNWSLSLLWIDIAEMQAHAAATISWDQLGNCH